MPRRAAVLRLLTVCVLGAACAEGVTTTANNEDDGGGAQSSVGAASSVGGANQGGGTNAGGAPAGGSGPAGGSASGGSAAGGSASGGSSTGGMGGQSVWINELHYDNDGADAGEGVEVAGASGTNLSLYTIELYSQGTLYDAVPLTGTLSNQQNGYGAAWIAITGIQNGPSDALALVVDSSSEVLAFLSYEGAVAATDGSAAGMTPVDIGVEEMATTPLGQSLQLVGTGHGQAAFSWMAPAAASPGQPNAGQTFQ